MTTLPPTIQKRLDLGRQMLQDDRTVGDREWQDLLGFIRRDFDQSGCTELLDYLTDREGGVSPEQECVGVRIQLPGLATLIATYRRLPMPPYWERASAIPDQPGLWAVAPHTYSPLRDWQRVPDLERALALAAEVARQV